MKEDKVMNIEEIIYMAENGETPWTDYPETENAGWDKLTILPAQLARFPLFSSAEASTETVIGKNAIVPLALSMPVMISHMSLGALTPELKCAIARAASIAGIANGSGDGGVLEEEIQLSSAYIYEYTPGLYGLTPEVLERCSAVEIKLGQGCGGGTPFSVPAGAPEEVYHMRGGEVGAFFTSPGRFSDLTSPADLRLMIEGLREGCGGKPIGIKLAAGNIEADLDKVLEAGADFVTIDGGSGGWRGKNGLMGGLPAVNALFRAKRHLVSRGSDIDIIIAGGIGTAADAAKALALGASAVAVASSVLTAACGSVTGTSPFSPIETEARITNYLRGMQSGLRDICAYTGRSHISELDITDLSPINLGLNMNFFKK